MVSEVGLNLSQNKTGKKDSAAAHGSIISIKSLLQDSLSSAAVTKTRTGLGLDLDWTGDGLEHFSI